jgi:flagellum-specific peptidoglycan hydrolase FlgJ
MSISAQINKTLTPAEFIAAIAPAAQQSMMTTRIPASFVIAQGALESGWGQHAPGMNLFGVKADDSWHGPITMKQTDETIKGKTVLTVAKFRAYDDWLGSIQDHSAFLLDNPRYKPAFTHCEDTEAFTRAIAAAGYATDPHYADKIIKVISDHQLKQYDVKARPA